MRVREGAVNRPPSPSGAGPGTVESRRDARLVGLATLAFVLSQGHLLGMLGGLEPNVLVLQLAFSPTAFREVLARWGDAGVAAYRAHFVFDDIHCFIYGGFGYLVATRTPLCAGARPGWRRALRDCLPVAGVCDLLENLAHRALLGATGDGDALLVPVASSLSLAKWLLVALFALVVAAALGRWGWRQWRGWAGGNRD